MFFQLLYQHEINQRFVTVILEALAANMFTGLICDYDLNIESGP
jgi:hypothetical protein